MAGRWPTYVGWIGIVQLLTACSGEPATDNASVPAASTHQNAAPAADARLVVAFGDSLYAGYGVAQSENFPNALQRALDSRGVAAEVRNAGVSGETTLGGRQRLDFTLDGLPRKPDLLLLGLGGNDMLRGLDPAQSEANLRAILDRLRVLGIPVMLTGMRAAPNMGADYANKFDAIYPRLAREYGIPLYPFFLDGTIGNPKLMQADSIHPNPAGVAGIAGKIAPLVAERLKPQT
ncbi:MAG: arylesterase [Sphingobium sp.]